MTKSNLAFQPAPRPQPRASAEDAKKLQEATQDLGFGRPTAAPAVAPEVSEAPIQESSAPPRPGSRPVASVAPAVTADPRPAAVADPAAKRGPALKFDVPETVWEELRLAALKRRVTVKFLVLEALAAKGYDVDLTAIPEDGRRLR